jgi:hypothetical protein
VRPVDISLSSIRVSVQQIGRFRMQSMFKHKKSAYYGDKAILAASPTRSVVI